MAQDGVLTPLGLADVKIAQMLTDPVGGSATYGPAYDVPGGQSISFTPDFLEKELRGDNKVLDQYSKVQSISGSCKHAKISLALQAIFMGGTISDSGSSPNEKRTLTVLGSDKPSYFRMEGLVDYRGGEALGGDFHIALEKVKIVKFQTEFQSEDYATVSFDFKGIPRDADDVLYTMEENETTVPLVAGAADTTPPTCTVVPADEATGVAVTTNVVWTFSEDLQPSTVNSGTFKLIKDDGTEVAATVTLANAGAATTVTLNPTSNLAGSSAKYLPLASNAVRDLAGNPMAAASVSWFTTA